MKEFSEMHALIRNQILSPGLTLSVNAAKGTSMWPLWAVSVTGKLADLCIFELDVDECMHSPKCSKRDPPKSSSTKEIYSPTISQEPMTDDYRIQPTKVLIRQSGQSKLRLHMCTQMEALDCDMPSICRLHVFIEECLIVLQVRSSIEVFLDFLVSDYNNNRS